ncbi:uncharacterized protein LOC104868315 [Fukomys damarensis]|uniref:uncharacterized protein LOC104868315 n=1 Tax=Fukomys damarensis TaxID=885580 RepID=UPI001455B195|nr:uncharacterized protein LOC104868315 [Fukomys damarensis]
MVPSGVSLLLWLWGQSPLPPPLTVGSHGTPSRPGTDDILCPSALKLQAPGFQTPAGGSCCNPCVNYAHTLGLPPRHCPVRPGRHLCKLDQGTSGRRTSAQGRAVRLAAWMEQSSPWSGCDTLDSEQAELEVDELQPHTVLPEVHGWESLCPQRVSSVTSAVLPQPSLRSTRLCPQQPVDTWPRPSGAPFPHHSRRTWLSWRGSCCPPSSILAWTQASPSSASAVGTDCTTAMPSWQAAHLRPRSWAERLPSPRDPGGLLPGPPVLPVLPKDHHRSKQTASLSAPLTHLQIGKDIRGCSELKTIKRCQLPGGEGQLPPTGAFANLAPGW